MQSEKAVFIKKGALITGVVVSGGALVLADSGDSVVAALLFALWLSSPYLVLNLISWLIERFTKVRGRYTIGCVVAGLMLGFTLLGYVGTFGDRSSTYGLIFIFMPFWLHLGGIGLYVLCILLSWLAEWSQRPAS